MGVAADFALGTAQWNSTFSSLNKKLLTYHLNSAKNILKRGAGFSRHMKAKGILSSRNTKSLNISQNIQGLKLHQRERWTYTKESALKR